MQFMCRFIFVSFIQPMSFLKKEEKTNSEGEGKKNKTSSIQFLRAYWSPPSC